eukprot:Hpha_TRINITY_DN15110_c2_g2::TRINITY_DN15110_c2_g2_i1::g.127150::m.127150/K01698/hemB, ALAD; porphobilinogen synthase
MPRSPPFRAADFPLVRHRRLRSSPGIRALVRETTVLASDLVQPLFLHSGKEDVPIHSMPGQSRLSVDSLVREAERAAKAGVRAIALFPKIPDEHKSVKGEYAKNPDGFSANAIRRVKAAVPELLLVADVALDPFTTTGQDGIVDPATGRILNDETVATLAEMGTMLAEVGADVVAPSDMMDGRILALRRGLEQHGHTETVIMSYAAKYASAYYGPFRDALDSAPSAGTDKRTYQMDPGNTDEALREVGADIAEGADIVMVKPGLAYLDILQRVKETFGHPTAVYHVSGELAMLHAAAANGWLNFDQTLAETLQAFKRAGADLIFTYEATNFAEKLRNA